MTRPVWPSGPRHRKLPWSFDLPWNVRYNRARSAQEGGLAETRMDPEETEFGERLVSEKLITDRQLRTALEYRNSLGGGRLRDIIVKLGFVKDAVLDSFVGQSMGMRAVDISDREIDIWAMERIPRRIIEKHQVIPLRHDHGADTILLAMGEPSNFAAIEEIQFLTNRKVETALATRAQVKKAINQYFNLLQDGEPTAAGHGGEGLGPFDTAAPEAAVRALARALVAKGVLTRADLEAQLGPAAPG